MSYEYRPYSKRDRWWHYVLVALLFAVVWGFQIRGVMSASEKADSEPSNPYLQEVCDIGPDRLLRCSTYDIRDGRP